MTEKDDGFQAFPMGYHRDGNSADHPGMTLRQYAAIKLCVPDSGLPWLDEMIEKARRNEYAGLAMQGFLASGTWNCSDEDMTERCRKIADALIEELKK